MQRIFQEWASIVAKTVNRFRKQAMQRTLSLLGLAGFSLGLLSSIVLDVKAQTPLREGKLQFVMLENMANDEFTVLSRGLLADLESDPFFDGDFDYIFNAALTILDDYTPVVRGGYFPENEGIPRDQQVTVDEGVYRLFRLDNGYELMLYRSPMENTSRYFIRQN
jgi:hypothetical protein